MSHFTELKTTIRDITALKSACKDLGLIVLEQGAARGYRNQTIAGDFIIRLQGPYDVALQKQGDGSYLLVTDWWNGHVEKEIGKNGGKLLQAYGVSVAITAARKKGYMVHKKMLEDGSVHLTINVK